MWRSSTTTDYLEPQKLKQIRLSISSLISLIFSIGLFLGSSIPQSITLGINNVGQKFLSIQPILMILSEFLIRSSVRSLDFCLDMSIPILLITCIASGLICEVGFVPALIGSKPSGAYFLL